MSVTLTGPIDPCFYIHCSIDSNHYSDINIYSYINGQEIQAIQVIKAFKQS